MKQEQILRGDPFPSRPLYLVFFLGGGGGGGVCVCVWGEGGGAT